MKKLFNSPDWATCPSCGAARSKGDQCGYCGTVYTHTIKRRNTKSNPGSLSSKYKVSRHVGEMRISWRWFSLNALFGSVFAIPIFALWNFLVFSQISDSWEKIVSDPLAYFPMLGILMPIGILVPLCIFRLCVQRTTIIANKSHLAIKKYPIFWGTNRKFRTDEIQQLFVSKSKRYSKKGTWYVPVLQLVTENDTRYRLLIGKEEVEFADYESMRQQLSNVLEIDTGAVLEAISN